MSRFSRLSFQFRLPRFRFDSLQRFTNISTFHSFVNCFLKESLKKFPPNLLLHNVLERLVFEYPYFDVDLVAASSFEIKLLNINLEIYLLLGGAAFIGFALGLLGRGLVV